MLETPRWMYIALSEARIGVREVAGEQHNPRILVYHATTDMKAGEDEIPWCASFVNWCLGQASVNGTSSATARSYLNWGIDLKPPAYGCLVVLKRGRHAWQGHVGFLVGRDTPESILLLGGNQANSVCVRPYLTKDVLSYKWPGPGDHYA